jgi:DHA1 family bicyclomycin/chloramphenicol resistance-like MFS transporter
VDATAVNSQPLAAEAGENRWAVLLALTATATLGIMASTIYVPSVPAIAAAFDTTVGHVQFTFVGYLLAFAIGMLLLGPVADRFGRRPTMIFGLVLSALASFACTLSPSIDFLIGARLVQGIGTCAGLVVGRAVVRDLYGREGAAQVIAGLAIALTLIQSFAPIPGGYLQAWFGWRANFAAVSLFALGALALALRFVPETRPFAAAPPETGFAAMFAGYRSLAATPRFLAYALAAAGAHAGFHIFTAGAPAVLIGSFHIPPEEYGFYAALPPIGFLLGSFLSNRLTRRLGLNTLIRVGCAVLVPAGLAMLALALLGVAGPYAVVGPMALVCCGSGLITPNAVAGGLGVNPRIVGAASGLTSFLQMATAAGGTAALALGPSGGPVILAAVIALAGALAASAIGLLTPSGRLAAADARA